ncbi:MAG TPA: hypothetical protein PLD55_04325 [bacterium]|nr:hypothetical protein [bacterium]
MLFNQKKIFDTENLKKVVNPKNKKKIIKINEKVDGLLPEKLKENECIHYASIAEFSVHDILIRLIELYGNVKIMIIATWSISNKAAEMVVDAKKNGMIEEIKMLLDWRVQVRTPKAKGLLNFNNVEMKVGNCHAKVFCVEMKSGEKITLLGSANLTNNPRIEAGIITQSSEIFDFHKNWMEEEMQNREPFGLDSARVRTGRDIGEDDDE